MTEAEFRDRIERALAAFPQIDGHRGPLSQTGEAYIELTVRTLSIDNLATAVVGALSAFGRDGDTLYWRVRPELSELTHTFYARFLFSQRPVIFASEEESRRAAMANV